MVSSSPSPQQPQLMGAQKPSTAALRTVRRFFPAIFTTFRRLLLWGSARRYLLSLLPFCGHPSFHTWPRAPILCSAWAHRARYQFGRSGKHDVGHVGGDVTDAGAIGDWWQCVNHRVRNLASKVRVRHQPPKVGQLRSFFGSVPLPPVWCGPAWDADFRVHEIVIRFWCL